MTHWIRPLLALGLFSLPPLGPAAGADLLAGPTWYLRKPAADVATVSADGTPGGSRTTLRITVAHATDPFYAILMLP